MLESLQTGVFEYEKLRPEEMQARGILGRLVGVMADSVNPTRNGRAYSKKLWENVFANPIMQERIENKCCFGELGHPTDREETDMEKIAICMDGIPKVDPDGKLRAVFNILDTPNGRILKTLCDYGCNIGISSRGSGDLVTDFDGNESVDPDTYNCEGWDAVLIPAVKEARLQYVTESLEKKRYNKSLRTRLQDAVNKADVDKKKAITESLHTFLGEDIWSEIDNDDVTEPEVGPEPDEEFVDNLEANSGEDTINTEDDFSASEGDDSDLFSDTDPEEDGGSLFDDIMSDPSTDLGAESKDFNYKGIDVKWDPASEKYVCEIDQETYVFNSEKNVKIWIDMNAEDVEKTKEANAEDEAEDMVRDAMTEPVEEETEEPVEETPEDMHESLNEEQIGRDAKSDKDIDEVQEPGKDDPEVEKDEEDDDKVVIRFNEAYGDLTEDATIAEFIRNCVEKLQAYDDRTDIELEIPDSFDTDLFWMDLNEAARETGIYMSMQEREEIDDSVYLYFYISKTDDFIRNFDDQLDATSDTIEDEIDRRQNEREKQWDIEEREVEESKTDWDRLNATEQFAVEAVMQHIEYNGLTEPIEDLVSQACQMYNEANTFDEYENEPFANEEASESNVLDYIKNNYSDKLSLDKLNYNESIEEEAVNNGAEVDSLHEMLQRNIDLEKKILTLQEKLSAANARETKLSEDLASYKDRVAKLSAVSKENRALKEQLKSTKDSSEKLNESVSKQKTTVKSLNEKLQKVTEERNSATEELESLRESYANLDKDFAQTKTQLTERVDRQNKLLEKYQKITKGSVDRYINLQATNLGIKPVEIKNRLPEKFSFSDVDTICEELREYKLNVSRLPFSTHNQLNERLTAKVNNLSRGLTPRNDVDELNDYDMKLMEMYK